VTPDQLRTVFPDDAPLPDLLVRLCAYMEAHDNALAADLDLTAEGQRSLRAGFQLAPDQDEADLSAQFIIFASDRSQSLYGYWRYEGQALDRAPLVYLNDEGQDNTVLTDTLEEFLTLVAVGQSFLRLVGKWDDGEEPDAYTLRYRTWLRAELGIEAPTLTQARAIVDKACARHPDLDAWLRQSVGL